MNFSGHVDTTRAHLDNFWELFDELLNAVLFVLIGLAVLLLSFQRPYLMAGRVAIPLVLLARWLSVVVQMKAFSFVREFSERAITILTWGGLRGGISVALALSLPLGATRDAVVMITYGISNGCLTGTPGLCRALSCIPPSRRASSTHLPSRQSSVSSPIFEAAPRSRAIRSRHPRE